MGCVPLHSTCQMGNTQIFQNLLEYAVDVNISDEFEWSPLHVPSQKGHFFLVSELLKAKAKINHSTIPDDEGYDGGKTPLHLACANGHAPVVQILLQNSADAKFRDDNGNIPLHCAVDKGNLQVVQQLLEFSEINSRNRYDWTPLHKACDYGHSIIVSELIKSKAGINLRTAPDVYKLSLLCMYLNFILILIVLDAESLHHKKLIEIYQE